MNELYNQIIVQWIEFKETHEYAWGEKRGDKFVMGTVEEDILKEIDLKQFEIND